jgi:hypothetical protein
VQGGGVYWRRGDIDDRPDKVTVLIPSEDGFREDGDRSVCVGVC